MYPLSFKKQAICGHRLNQPSDHQSALQETLVRSYPPYRDRAAWSLPESWVVRIEGMAFSGMTCPGT